MPLLERPGGVALHWEARAEGSPVVLVNQFIGVTDLYSDLLDDLAADHRLIVYDPRGTGESTRRGPYDLETDVADLEALVDEIGAPVLVLGVSDGNNRAVRLAAQRPELIDAVVAIAGSTLGQTPVGSDALAGSTGVLSAFITLMGADLRAGVTAMMTAGGSQMSEERLRRRIDESADYTVAEAAAARLRAWVQDDCTPEAQSLGDRLTILAFGGNPWFPVDQADRMRRALPQARVLELQDGPISRPDITAAIVRRITTGD